MESAESEGVVVEIMWPKNIPDEGPLIVGWPKGFLAWLGSGTDNYRLTRIQTCPNCGHYQPCGCVGLKPRKGDTP